MGRGGGLGYLQVVLQHLAAVQEGGAGLAQVAEVHLRRTGEGEGDLRGGPSQLTRPTQRGATGNHALLPRPPHLPASSRPKPHSHQARSTRLGSIDAWTVSKTQLDTKYGMKS